MGHTVYIWDRTLPFRTEKENDIYKVDINQKIFKHMKYKKTKRDKYRF